MNELNESRSQFVFTINRAALIEGSRWVIFLKCNCHLDAQHRMRTIWDASLEKRGQEKKGILSHRLISGVTHSKMRHLKGFGRIQQLVTVWGVSPNLNCLTLRVMPAAPGGVFKSLSPADRLKQWLKKDNEWGGGGVGREQGEGSQRGGWGLPVLKIQWGESALEANNRS